MLDVEARIEILGACQVADEQQCSDEENERDRDLSDDEEVTQRPAPADPPDPERVLAVQRGQLRASGPPGRPARARTEQSSLG